MSPFMTSCCPTVLHQQQESNLHHQNRLAHQLADDASASFHPSKRKYCTVVENGRVVVKPIASVPSQLDVSTETPSTPDYEA
ncbi:MAG: hypothetical protein LDL41_03175 [Coleofasciculus sp. S288]|nr:hypothetical protein [Coleofasciculus sp. S288]